METAGMMLRKPPYGDINAAEAVRHALGAVSDDLKVMLFLVDGGVMLAKKGHDESGTGFTNLEGALRDCIDMGVEVYAESGSMREQELDPSEMVEGVKVIAPNELSAMVQEVDTLMIF